MWKGGRYLDDAGYVCIRIPKDDPFCCMNNGSDFCFEHRYIMAKKLNRPLESWEVVHHKGIRYPMGSKEDKGDNLEDNLELVTNPENVQLSRMQEEIDQLGRMINWLCHLVGEQTGKEKVR
jgi:hypothetical protein